MADAYPNILEPFYGVSFCGGDDGDSGGDSGSDDDEPGMSPIETAEHIVKNIDITVDLSPGGGVTLETNCSNCHGNP